MVVIATSIMELEQVVQVEEILMTHHHQIIGRQEIHHQYHHHKDNLEVMVEEIQVLIDQAVAVEQLHKVVMVVELQVRQ